MQYLKVQYARTDVLANKAETYTKESKTGSNSFQSILESMQNPSNKAKLDPKDSPVSKEKSTDAGINTSIKNEQKNNGNQAEVSQVKAKKTPEAEEEGKELNDSLQIENDENQIYMIVDLSNTETDPENPLKDLDFEEASESLEFIGNVELGAEKTSVKENSELETLVSEAAMLSSDVIEVVKDPSVEENAQSGQIPASVETETALAENKTASDKMVSKLDDKKTESQTPVKEERKVFTIVDERTQPVQEEEKKTALDVREVKSSSQNQNAQSVLLTENARANILSTNDQSASATGSTFQQMLSQQIQQNAPEFAKAGTIILKDQNSGSINMILKPENLGNVKISLQLTDKNISGHIVVQSKEAMEAFKENLDLLRQSFQKNGFENAQLSLSLADSSSQHQFAQNQSGNDGQLVADRAYKEYGQSGEEKAASSDSSKSSSASEYQIDVVA